VAAHDAAKPAARDRRETHVRIGRTLLLMILLLALAACGEQTATAPASASASAAASTEASAASAEASAAASDDEGGSASLDCAALEALMPSSIGEATITTTCLSGEEITQAGGSVPLDELEDAGVELENAAVAIGSGSDGSAGAFMYSLPGADTDAFRDQMASGLEQAMSGAFSAATLGGKQVLKAEGGQGLPSNHYLYVSDDLLVWILAPDDDAAATVLAALP
jgi:hypothetical protein